MAASAAGWMKASGMAVKSEFVTPWGICDLVGLSFNPDNVAHRLRLRQTRAVSSITRAVLLLRIPDVNENKSISLGRLVRQCGPTIPEEIVSKEAQRLIDDRFVVQTSRGRLQKVNGWMPLQDRLVAIELKLSRIDEAMHQALKNLGFAEESYIGLPANVARRVASNTSRWSQFFDAGIGLLSVARQGCRVVVPSRKCRRWTDAAIQFYCVEKFWRSRPKGN